jgi:hypothetical protein
VFTLRCTAKLLKRLKRQPETVTVQPSTRLGDWYAHLLFTRPAQLVLCVSERTLLPVLVPAREIETLLGRARHAVWEMLEAIGVSEEAAREEQRAMATATLARTTSRRVVGSLNDFVRLLEPHLGLSTSLLELSLGLADTPCSPLQMESPRRATLRLFDVTPDGSGLIGGAR